jgi:hypothetical protein
MEHKITNDDVPLWNTDLREGPVYKNTSVFTEAFLLARVLLII